MVVFGGISMFIQISAADAFSIGDAVKIGDAKLLAIQSQTLSDKLFISEMHSALIVKEENVVEDDLISEEIPVIALSVVEDSSNEVIVEDVEEDIVSSDTAENQLVVDKVAEIISSKKKKKKKSAATVVEEKVVETDLASVENTVIPDIDVTIQIVGGSGGISTISIPVGSSVEDAMQQSAIVYSSKSFGGLGAYVESIGGLAEDGRAGMYWILYINGSRSALGMSNVILNAGDSVMWKYEKKF